MRIKNATQQLNLGLISSCQFLQRCSYVTEGYEQRQRIWALRNNDEMADEEQIEQIELGPEHLEQIPPLEVQLNVRGPPARRSRELPLEERVDVADPPAESSVCMVCMVVAVNGTAAEYRNFAMRPCMGVCIIYGTLRGAKLGLSVVPIT